LGEFVKSSRCNEFMGLNSEKIKHWSLKFEVLIFDFLGFEHDEYFWVFFFIESYEYV
jgi:hypothetical protein